SSASRPGPPRRRTPTPTSWSRPHSREHGGNPPSRSPPKNAGFPRRGGPVPARTSDPGFIPEDVMQGDESNGPMVVEEGQALEALEPRARRWSRAEIEEVDVLVIGGGQGGVAVGDHPARGGGGGGPQPAATRRLGSSS